MKTTDLCKSKANWQMLNGSLGLSKSKSISRDFQGVRCTVFIYCDSETPLHCTDCSKLIKVKPYMLRLQPKKISILGYIRNKDYTGESYFCAEASLVFSV